jgi:F-type H+-transporting ATPase subunit b
LELNWTTFILEIVNFLVLVWILKKFLYRPVQAALKQRQQTIDQKLDEANRLKVESSALEQQYQSRMAEWDRERQQAEDALHEEIQSLRTIKLEQLEQELAGEREKAAVNRQRHETELQQKYQQLAHRQGAGFAASLLSSVAGPELDQRLFDLLLDTLEQLDRAQLARLRDNGNSAGNKISILSASVLSDTRKKQLQQKLSELCETQIEPEFEQDSGLIAGLRLTFGAWVLHLNIADELKGFADLIHEQSAD